MENVYKPNLECNFVEEEYKVDVRYVNESEGLRLIVDSGAPMPRVSAGWLEKYLREINLMPEMLRREVVTEGSDLVRKFIRVLRRLLCQ